MTAKDHGDCAGHAAYINASFWANDSDDDQPSDLQVTAIYLCTDPTRYGRLRPYGGPTQPTTTPKGGPDQAEDPAESEVRVEQEAEHQRQRRRELIRLNKEAGAAQQVRREFLRQALQAKSLHRQMSTWALAEVVNRDPTYCRWASEYYRTSAVLNELTGSDPTLTANAARHGVLLWAHVVTAHEGDLPRDAHRDHSRYRAEYLRHLQSIGYPISDVEQRILNNAPIESHSETANPATTTDD